MEVLNESLRFEDLSADDREAFRGSPSKVLIHGGTTLFRFATDGDSLVLGAWWVTRETYQMLALRAERLETPLAVFARSKLAVKDEWNKRMNRLYIGTLLCDVFGFDGLARHKPVADGFEHIIRPGNFPQIWLGNLSPVQMRLAACDL